MVDGRMMGQHANAMTISLRKLAVTASLALVGMLAMFSAAPATATDIPGVQEFEANVSTTQAGGHPNVALHFKVNGYEPFGVDPPCGKAPECLMPKTFHTHFPTGFIGNPHVVPKCTLTDYNQQACPSDAQVGVMDVGGALQPGLKLIVPVYNMETRPDQAGLLAFFVPLLSSPVFLELSGRTDSDYGLDVISSELLPLPVKEVHGYLWGVPAEPSHDKLRFVTPLQGLAACFEQSAGPPPPFGEFENCQGEPGSMGVGSTIPPLPYTQNPTTCGVPLEASFEVRYYNGESASASWPFPAMTGCQQMSFNPASDGRADIDPDGHPVGAGHDPQSAPATERGDRGGLRAADHADHPSRGLLDQPRRRRRQGRLPGLRVGDRHALRVDVPRVLEDRDGHPRRRRPAGPPSRRHVPGRAEAGRPVPGAVQRQRIRDQRQAARLGAA